MIPLIGIREAREGDADEVFELLAGFVTSYLPNRAIFDLSFRELIGGGAASLLVAEREGMVLGYILTSMTTTLYANGPVMQIWELTVGMDYRGAGVGTSLVRAAAERAAALGCRELVVATRRAAGFYARFGFCETAALLKRPIPPDQAGEEV